MQLYTCGSPVCTFDRVTRLVSEVIAIFSEAGYCGDKLTAHCFSGSLKLLNKSDRRGTRCHTVFWNALSDITDYFKPHVHGPMSAIILAHLLFSLYTTPLSCVIYQHAIPHQLYTDDSHLYVSFASCDSTAELKRRVNNSAWPLSSHGCR